MYSAQEPISKPVTFYEATARALKYNLDYRLKLMENALTRSLHDVASLEMLPRLVAGAGYVSRSNDSGGRSIGIGDGVESNLTADVRMKGRMSDVEKGQSDKFQADGKLILLGMNYVSDSLPPVGINSLYFDFSPRFLALTSFDGNVGSSNIQAKGRMDNYIQWWLKDSTLVGSFDLTANKFDLNELMGPSAPEDTTAAADTSAMSVIEVPGNIDFRMGMACEGADLRQHQPHQCAWWATRT